MRGLDAEQAPAELHASVQALIDAEQAPERRARSRAWRLAPAAAVAIVAIALAAVLLSSGSSSTPERQPGGATGAAPAHRTFARGEPGPHVRRCTRTAGGISFPYWRHDLGWRTSGARNDSYGGRSATTVFYTGPNAFGRHRAGRLHDPLRDPLPLPNDPGVVEHRGTRYYVLSHQGATVVTWRRNGHTCILAARGLAPETLLHLAAWA